MEFAFARAKSGRGRKKGCKEIQTFRDFRAERTQKVGARFQIFENATRTGGRNNGICLIQGKRRARAAKRAAKKSRRFEIELEGRPPPLRHAERGRENCKISRNLRFPEIAERAKVQNDGICLYQGKICARAPKGLSRKSNVSKF